MTLFKVKIAIVLLVGICIFSCKDNITKKKEVIIDKINKEWVGKKIMLPNTILQIGKIVDSKKKLSKYKIVGFYDGHCSMCYAQLAKWNKVMENYRNEGLDNVSFMFVFSGNSKGYVEYSINQIGFPLNFVSFDSKDVFITKYPFVLESGYKYSSILLDKNDKVLFVGNPTISNEDYKMFLNIIKN